MNMKRMIAPAPAMVVILGLASCGGTVYTFHLRKDANWSGAVIAGEMDKSEPGVKAPDSKSLGSRSAIS